MLHLPPATYAAILVVPVIGFILSVIILTSLSKPINPKYFKKQAVTHSIS
jgi:hypothetical protein